MNITEPLRLAVGSHQAGSGKGCAMNVVSWENGDTKITDLPSCSDPFLARVVQRVNDTICTHRDDDLLCPECSLLVLGLAHRTVGTGVRYLNAASHSERSRVYDALDAFVVIFRIAAISTATAVFLRRAHRVIDRFYELTGLTEHSAPEPAVVEPAVEKMLVKA